MSGGMDLGVLTNDAPRATTVRRIREWVETGVLVQGMPLPSERALSTRLSVSRETVRRALEVLTRDGLIKAVGPRTRLVTNQPGPRSAAARGVLAHSIAVLAPEVRAEEVIHKRQPGWIFHFTQGAHEEISAQGYNLISIHPGRLTDADLRRVIDGRPTGVVCPEVLGNTVSARQKWLQTLSAAGIPIVVYGNMPDIQSYDRVASDHDAGGYALTRWLLERGCRRPAMFFSSDPDTYWVRGRRSGYERAMTEAGLPPLPTIPFASTPDLTDRRELFERSRRLLAGYLVEHVRPDALGGPVDALLLESDGLAYPAAAACRLLGRNPGSDILLAGYDHYAMDMAWERQVEPVGPAVTMDKRNTASGRELVRLLLDRCQGKLPDAPQLRLVPPELVVYPQPQRGASPSSPDPAREPGDAR